MEFEQVKQLEIELSDPAIRKNSRRVAQLLADDFEEVGSSGRKFSKKDIIQLLADEVDITYTLHNFSFISLSSNCILVKYETRVQDKHSYRSSVWVKQHDQWVMQYHQGTTSNK
jgi:ribonuclease HI